MSDFFPSAAGVFNPGPYATALAGTHREVCGEEVGFSRTFDDFVGGLAREGSPANLRLFRDITRGAAAAPVADVAYRRFLDRGAGCREGSPGHRRWLSIRDPQRLPSEQIAPLVAGGILAAGRVAIGTPEEMVSPSEVSAALALPAAEEPLVGNGIPRLARLGNIAYDGNSTRPFGDVIDVPATAGTPAVTVVRGIDGYSASILIDGVYQGDVSIVEDYMRRIQEIQDPQLFVAAWNEYVRVLFEHIQELMPVIADFAEAQEKSLPLRLDDVRRAFAALKTSFAARRAFYRPPPPPLSGTWELLFVGTQIAKLNNSLGGIFSLLDFFLSGESDGQEFTESQRIFSRFGDPFDHIHFSYGGGGVSPIGLW